MDSRGPQAFAWSDGDAITADMWKVIHWTVVSMVSGLGEADPQEIPLSLQLSNALELDPELVALRRRELLELAEAALERRDCGPAVLTGVAQRV
jgi:hypothetical protein